jgi:hypothetical protein
VVDAIIVVAILLVSGVLGRTVVRRHSGVADAIVSRGLDEARLALGTYDLRMVMRSMLNEVVASAVPSLERSYLPNDLRFGLHPRDIARWGGYADGLVSELELLMGRELAGRPDFALLGDGRLHLEIHEDSEASPGRPTFRGCVRQSAAAHGSVKAPVSAQDGHTEPIAFGGATALYIEDDSPWSLRVPGQPSVTILGQMLIGRDRKHADIVFDDRWVSREHAHLSWVDGTLTIVDLDSVNGTFVNGARIASEQLVAGDVVRVGRGVSFRIERAAAGKH